MVSQKTQYIISLLFLTMFIHCRDIPALQKSEEEKLFGRWRLTNSSVTLDSSFIGSSFIEFTKGNYFKSSTSFFWTNDSTKFQPRSGSYSIFIESDPFMLSRHECCHTFIILTSDSVSHNWVFSRDSLTMYWSSEANSPVRYTWTVIK